jgi:hypothetical protein
MRACGRQSHTDEAGSVTARRPPDPAVAAPSIHRSATLVLPPLGDADDIVPPD